MLRLLGAMVAIGVEKIIKQEINCGEKLPGTVERFRLWASENSRESSVRGERSSLRAFDLIGPGFYSSKSHHYFEQHKN